ncbi:NADH dehydrogenase (ubiquinone) complex I, assembly factor 6 [Acrodontium crateriforme]|uniref:NADH dehydrogenase (Ubiquinone) complex I, assembly factor 6 n=1 Tax=Acrodontium crateriforme TaxID=150365 RepID=A0AAQ3R6J8_9PEZI|nr:NADH dehydrogenase (ubiquinone) complex I, assembly factor 6 [Acrodontium crateriforme]
MSVYRSTNVTSRSLCKTTKKIRSPVQCFKRHASSQVEQTSTSISSVDEINRARNYCLDLLRKYDTPSSLLLPYIPRQTRDAYIALRAFNIDVARTADTTSTPTIGAMRLQFQREAVTKSLAGTPPKQPIALLLAKAAEELNERTSGKGGWRKSWFMRIIDTREKYLSNPPYPTLETVESYAENTYSTLLYLTLQALPMASLTADHVASHIGKATGIATVLRGIPLLAFPGPPNKHSNQGGQFAGDVGATRHGAVMLPLDVMADAGVREEDVLRNGANAQGLKDAVFAVATRANDHLITARQMMTNINQGEDAGHEFEHRNEEEHAYLPSKDQSETPKQEIERAFGVFMPALATQIWLDRLQQSDFDIFSSKLRVTDWKLPFKAYWAFSRRNF